MHRDHARLPRPLLSLALILSLIVLSTPAPTRAAGHLEERRAQFIEGLYPTPHASVGLAAAAQTLEPAQRVALAAQLRGMLLTYLSPRLADQAAVDALGPWAARILAPSVALVRATEPPALLAALGAYDLDHAAPVPLAAFRLAHGSALADPVPGTTTPRGAIMAADQADPRAWAAEAAAAPGYVIPDGAPPMTELTLLGPADVVPTAEVPVDSVKPGPYGFFQTGDFVVPAPAHALVNSTRLARALNELTNDRASTGPLTVHAGGRTFTASTPGQLVERLASMKDVDVRVYDARTLQDFFNYYVKRSDELVAVRFATWFALGLDPVHPDQAPAPDASPLLLPADHSEHLTVVWKKGTCEPLAMVKWYMGITSGPTVQGMRFRPATACRSSWNNYRVVRSYTSTRHVRRMVDAAASLQRFHNFVQTRLKLPLWGYGYHAVCNDSTALMETVLQGSPRDVAIWGVVRDQAYEFYLAPWTRALGLRLTTDATGRRVLGVPSDTYPELAPWAASRAGLLSRLGSTISTREPSALHFPDVRICVEVLADRCPTFRRALVR